MDFTTITITVQIEGKGGNFWKFRIPYDMEPQIVDEMVGDILHKATACVHNVSTKVYITNRDITCQMLFNDGDQTVRIKRGSRCRIIKRESDPGPDELDAWVRFIDREDHGYWFMLRWLTEVME